MTRATDDPETAKAAKRRRRIKPAIIIDTADRPYARRHGPRGAQGRASRARENAERDPDPTRPAGAAAMPVPRLKSLPDVAAEDRRLPGSVLALPRKVGSLDRAFFEQELPSLNSSVSAGALTTAAFVDRIRSGLSAADLAGLERIGSRMDEQQRFWTLTALGVLASSLVRHARRDAGDRETSAGLNLVPGLERALLVFGKLAGRIPRDSADGVWNGDTAFSYTESEGEKRFGKAVREAERILGDAVRLLEPVRQGDQRLAEAVTAIEAAADLVAEYVAIQADLASRAFPADFIEMRDFLAPYSVGGRARQGPNATNSASWTSLDLAVGLLGRGFHQIARARTRFMAAADRARVKASLTLPSLCDLLADEFGISRTHFPQVSRRTLLARIGSAAPQTRRAAIATARLAHEVSRLGAVHGGAIRRNLVDPASAMTAEEQMRHPAPVGGGVGGRALEHTLELRERRLRHPLKAIHAMKEFAS